MIRVPTAMVVEIRALIRDRKLAPAAREVEAKVRAGIEQAGRGELEPYRRPPKPTAEERRSVSFPGGDLQEPEGGDSRQPEGVVCGQCGRAVPSLRYRGRQHAAGCSKFDRTVA